MDILPYELQLEPLMHLSYEEILRYCAVNTWARSIYADQSFWKQKYQHDFGRISGSTIDLDWRNIYKRIVNPPSDFFSAGNSTYAFIDNLGNLYYNRIHTKDRPRREALKFFSNDNFINVSSNEVDLGRMSDSNYKLGIITKTGEAYFLKRVPDLRFVKIELPIGRQAYKINLTDVGNSYLPVDIYVLIMDDFSVWYNYTNLNNSDKLKKLELSAKARDLTVRYEYSEYSSGKNEGKIIVSTFTNDIHIFSILRSDDKSRGPTMSDWIQYDIQFNGIITLPVMPQKVLFNGHRYIILSMGGEIYVSNEKNEFIKIEMAEKVTWIDQRRYTMSRHDYYFFHVIYGNLRDDHFKGDIVVQMYVIVTENGKVYLWKDVDNVIPLYLFLSKDTWETIEMPNYPIEIQLTGNEIMRSSVRFYMKGNRLDPLYGMSLTKDGTIANWELYISDTPTPKVLS